MSMPKFFVVATPIGNRKDISQRAIEVLNKVDLILCEDTRVSKKLLNFYQIKTPLLPYHQHSKLKKINIIFEHLKKGKDLALISDAGTPGICDPGGKLIEFIVKNLPDIEIISIPGASALTATISISGFDMQRFLFLGYPPKKKKRNKFLEKIKKSEFPVVIFESKFQILRTLQDIADVLGDKRKIFIARELTKIFEETFRGTVSQAIERLKNKKPRGEYTIIIATSNKRQETSNA